MTAPLLTRLRDEADQCRQDGADDIARLLDEAAEEIHNLSWALGLPGFDRMATDEQEAEHQVGVQRVNDVLERMEKAKAEHDVAMADAARYRWLRAHGNARWEVCMDDAGRSLLEGEALDAAIDAAICASCAPVDQSAGTGDHPR